MDARELTTHSAEETVAFGRTLAELLSPPKIVLLRGDLGAGKTTLVKGIAEGFQAASEEDVTSPTFTLVHEYRGPRANQAHPRIARTAPRIERERAGSIGEGSLGKHTLSDDGSLRDAAYIAFQQTTPVTRHTTGVMHSSQAIETPGRTHGLA